MGCGSSQTTSSTSLGSANGKPNLDKSPSSLRKQVLISQSGGGGPHSPDNRSLDGEANNPRADSRSTCRDSGIDSAKTNDGRRGARHASLQSADQSRNDGIESRQEAVPTPVAFEVAVGETKGQSIVKQHPPKRLQMKMLESDEPNKVTAEVLAERQRVADERRFQELQKRAKSAKHTSRRRKDILAAREFDDSQTAEAHQKKLDEKITSAEKSKAKHAAEMQGKQKLRQLRAAQVKEKARRLNQINDEDDAANFEVEKDETFNADDEADSWLDGQNNALGLKGSASTNNSERIYDGRSSPTKKYHPLTSAEVRRRQHSLDSDNDDEDNNEAGGNQWASHSLNTSSNTGAQDNFFDT